MTAIMTRTTPPATIYGRYEVIQFMGPDSDSLSKARVTCVAGVPVLEKEILGLVVSSVLGYCWLVPSLSAFKFFDSVVSSLVGYTSSG